ncbi:MAG: hypothetical protein ABL986_08965 [Vicinamibacterales bacterium]
MNAGSSYCADVSLEPPILIVAADEQVIRTVLAACEQADPQRPIMLLPQAHKVRTYLRDSVATGRCPATVVVSIDPEYVQPWALVHWIREQPAPVGKVSLVVVSASGYTDAERDDDLLLVRPDSLEDLSHAVVDALTRRKQHSLH